MQLIIKYTSTLFVSYIDVNARAGNRNCCSSQIAVLGRFTVFLSFSLFLSFYRSVSCCQEPSSSLAPLIKNSSVSIDPPFVTHSHSQVAILAILFNATHWPVIKSRGRYKTSTISWSTAGCRCYIVSWRWSTALKWEKLFFALLLIYRLRYISTATGTVTLVGGNVIRAVCVVGQHQYRKRTEMAQKWHQAPAALTHHTTCRHLCQLTFSFSFSFCALHETAIAYHNLITCPNAYKLQAQPPGLTASLFFSLPFVSE